MTYKCKRTNDEVCTITSDNIYAAGNTVEIKLPNEEALESVTILEVIE